MRLPIRRSQRLKRYDDDDKIHLTPEGYSRLKEDLARLEREKPTAVEDVVRTGAFGDFSENAEYQEAKFRLRRINARIFSISDRMKRVVLIGSVPSKEGVTELGSTVVIESAGVQKTYRIVGPSEAAPARGRISHVSPLGQALIGHAAGESVTVTTETGERKYVIIRVTS